MNTTTTETHVPDKWDATQVPSFKGKLAVITGANSSIGYETALELARKGADVVLACRSEERGKEAQHKIQQELLSVPDAGKVEFAKLDVSSLKSVKDLSTEFLKTHDRLNLLINNAGIMSVPHALTVDGYESQFATNHLGHFALTTQLFGLIKKSAPSRIVNVSSMAHRQASKFNEDAVMTPKDKYAAWSVYSDTKLCNILFTKELDRRIKAAGIQGVTAAVAHPGTTVTNLMTVTSTENTGITGFFLESRAQVAGLPAGAHGRAAHFVRGGRAKRPGRRLLWPAGLHDHVGLSALGGAGKAERVRERGDEALDAE